MSFGTDSDEDLPDLIRQLRATESILEYLTSDIDRGGLPGLWHVLEVSRTYCQELMSLYELTGGLSGSEGLRALGVARLRRQDWPTTRSPEGG